MEKFFNMNSMLVLMKEELSFKENRENVDG